MIGSYQDPAILVYDLKEILGWPELLELSEGYKWRECPTDAHIIRIMLSTLHGVIVPYAGYSGIYLCDEVILGNRCKIGAGSQIGERTTIGEDSRIGGNCRIGPDVIIGAGTTSGSESKVGDGSTIGDGTTIGAGCRLGEWSPFLNDQSAVDIGPRTRIGDGVVLAPETQLPPDVVIPTGSVNKK